MLLTRQRVRLRLLAVGMHLFYGAAQVLVLYPFVSLPRRRRLRQVWSRQLLCLLGIRVLCDSDRFARLDAGLAVCNHVSFADILAINTVLPSGFVAKSEVATWPLIGWLAKRNETVFIERGSRKAAHRAQESMVAALRGNGRLVIFPEGTTTRGDRVLPFHAALFQSAIDAGVPVHALLIDYRDSAGRRSEAPAYVDDVGMVECMEAIIASGGLTVRIATVASYPAPQVDRRRLAHTSHHAVARGLAAISCAISP